MAIFMSTHLVEDVTDSTYCVDLDSVYVKVWETSCNDIMEAKTARESMCLIPLKSEQNTYIGILVNEDYFTGKYGNIYVG